MVWNWQQPDWPGFTWDGQRLAKAESRFLLQAGSIFGAVEHLHEAERDDLAIASMSEQAVASSQIEGEILNRASVQSSIRRELGHAVDHQRASPAEKGMATMMVDLHRSAGRPLSARTLCTWHAWIMQGQRGLRNVGRYRTHGEPMQIVSGRLHDPVVHYEAPPSSRVGSEMRAFINWFNRSGPSGADPLPALTRAGIAHLYFESIHPFEDGNGRIGRAISEKALAQGLGRPAFIALAPTILIHRRPYYDRLAAASRRNEISEWLTWFAAITLEAQQRGHASVGFLIDKAKLMDRLRDQLNTRQSKVLLRVMQEGHEGFKGGLSAGNYMAITQTSPATARRDLADLVAKEALVRTGERKHTRYHLNIPLRPVSPVQIDRQGNITGLALASS